MVPPGIRTRRPPDDQHHAPIVGHRPLHVVAPPPWSGGKCLEPGSRRLPRQRPTRPTMPNQLLKRWKASLVASGVNVTCMKT